MHKRPPVSLLVLVAALAVRAVADAPAAVAPPRPPSRPCPGPGRPLWPDPQVCSMQRSRRADVQRFAQHQSHLL